MALGDTYLLRSRQRTTYGVELENVYFYRGTGVGLALNLCQAFADDITPLVAALQPVDVTHYLLEAGSLFDLTDFGSLAISVAGTILNETSAPFTAVNFTLRVPTRAIRPGSKRIGPVPESVIQNGVINDAPYILSVGALVLALDDVIEPSANPAQSFEPVLVKRILIPGSDPKRYRLPATIAEATISPVTQVAFSNIVSHQVSRERT